MQKALSWGFFSFSVSAIMIESGKSMLILDFTADIAPTSELRAGV